MPSAWVQNCEGYATYRWHEDGGIEVRGDGFVRYPDNHWRTKAIKKFWSKYGTIIVDKSKRAELPLSWVAAIITIESGGDEWGCSPCKKYVNGVQNCSFAPNCGGGVAKDGKTYSCCAYGLMQVINSEAVKQGYKSGADLLGNPDAAIDAGVNVFIEKLKYAKGNPILACKYYNGGSAKCNGTGIFGIGGQGNYTEAFARSVNTFLDLDLDMPNGFDPVRADEQEASMGLLGWGVVAGSLALSYFAAKRWL